MREVTGGRLAPGTVLRRSRGCMDPWPRSAAWVYILFDERGALLYIGKSTRPKTRVRLHGQRMPWAEVELISCASESEALAIEGDPSTASPRRRC